MRLISLCPSLTELIFGLGQGPNLIARTRYCIHPAAGVRTVETVGGTKDPDLDRILALEPDLVLVNKEENRLEDALALEQAGLEILVTEPESIDDTIAMVRWVGQRLGCQEEAEDLGAAIAASQQRAIRSAREAPTVSWAYLIWRKPWMTVNRQTFIHSLLSCAGSCNVFADAPERYPQITIAQLIEAAPDVVFLSTEPFPFAEKYAAELATQTGWSQDRFQIVDGELLSWYGSRTPSGIDYAVEVISRCRSNE